MSRLAAVIDLGPSSLAPRADRGDRGTRPAGNGASVLEYTRDLERAFAIPILSVTEYPGMSAADLRAQLGHFHPPQGYIRLGQHPQLLAVCEKAAAETPVRQLRVDHDDDALLLQGAPQAGRCPRCRRRPSGPANEASPLRRARMARELDAGGSRRGNRPPYSEAAIPGSPPSMVSGWELGRHTTSIGYRRLCVRSTSSRRMCCLPTRTRA